MRWQRSVARIACNDQQLAGCSSGDTSGGTAALAIDQFCDVVLEQSDASLLLIVTRGHGPCHPLPKIVPMLLWHAQHRANHRSTDRIGEGCDQIDRVTSPHRVDEAIDHFLYHRAQPSSRR